MTTRNILIATAIVHLVNVLVWLFVFSSFAKADTVAKYGIGVARSADGGYSTTKHLSLSRQSVAYGMFVQQIELGFWTDSARWQGRSGSVYGDYSVGLETQTVSGIYAQTLVGPALISSPDAYLGGYFQINTEATLGIRGENGISIGLLYKHLSSAGIYKPNVGRDFLLFRVGVPF